MWTSKILLLLYCLYVFLPQVWWNSSCSNYWEHPRGEGPKRAHGPSHGHVSRLLRCSRPQTRRLCLGRDLGESKDNVSYEMKCTLYFEYVYKMYLSFKSVLFFRCECYDYLFDIAVQMKQCGLDPAALPTEDKGIVWHIWVCTINYCYHIFFNDKSSLMFFLNKCTVQHLPFNDFENYYFQLFYKVKCQLPANIGYFDA